MLSVSFNPFPLLATERLLLRQVSTEDAEEMFQLRSDPRVMQYIDRPIAASVQDALEFIQKIENSLTNNDGINWGITLKDQRKLIGTIGFWRIMKEHYRAEIGYALLPQFQRKGIMQEAIAIVLDYGFNTMKLHSVEANVNPANTASIKFLEKNRFVREAYFKENYYWNGKFLDSIIYSLLNV
ncbi:MAG TPA: GNAT family N-acetyltransferase [Chitinophagales bacterium]|nr:GNAT family N-acetyltransferase [Chitinophagales bacterium]